MPRQTGGTSSLRNRNRVTNKTRLKVIKESIDADPIVLDEDEEKARVVSTAGVDAEDANEHHLQAVLSAAATRHQSIARSTRAAADKEAEKPAAYIPTPDSTGIVDNYEELYPPKRWTDPTNYVKSSDTVEESISFALQGGFIYYMDERDKEWLDRNNEEARGEGTSAQGAISGSTRSSRSSKAKGKDPEVPQPVAMTEDEFELVMAVFEKVTHEKTEFLHHGLDQGAPFPPFNDYQDVFSKDLEPTLFATYEVPRWVPNKEKLLRLSRAVYPYWRERRIERGGHPIIPSVNLDETDTTNESYICFRHREIKAVRKTRAQQTMYGDRLVRLMNDLRKAKEVAREVRNREQSKKEVADMGQTVWEKRFVFVDLKRKHPILTSKEDDDLLHDKERVPKKIKAEPAARPVVRLHAGIREPAVTQEPIMHPKARLEIIQKQIESEMARRKEKDHHWEDAIDNPYQSTPSTYSSRLFKFIQTTRAAEVSADASVTPTTHLRAARLRYGRGGRILLDRRLSSPRPLLLSPSRDGDSDVESKEMLRRLQEQWKFDDDDAPATGPEGSDEQDRELVDDQKLPYLVWRAGLMAEPDFEMLQSDRFITAPNPEGRMEQIPYRPMPPAIVRSRERSIVPPQRLGLSPTPASAGLRHLNGSSVAGPPANGTAAVSMPTHLKSMPPPASISSLKVSANGGMSASTSSTSSVSPTVSKQPSQLPARDNTHVNGMQVETGGAMKNEQDVKLTVPSQASGVEGVQADIVMSPAPTQASPHMSPPVPHKSSAQQHTHTAQAMSNGHYIPAVNGYNAHMPAGYLHAGVRANGLTPLKAANYSNHAANQLNSTQGGGVHMPIRPPNPYMTHANADFNAQLAMARQLQWQNAQRQVAHGLDANGTDNSAILSPSMVPPRVPSSNSTRGVSLSRGMPSPGMQHAMSPAQGRASPANQHMVRLAPHSPSPHHLSPSLAAQQAQSTATRPPQPQPQPHLPSPSLQPRQVVGSTGAGY